MNSTETMKSKVTATFFVYKGTCFPIMVFEEGDKQGAFHNVIVKNCLDMITDNLKMGKSKESQIKVYLQQVTIIQEEIVKIEKRRNLEEYDEKARNKEMMLLCDTFSTPQDELHLVWAMNINALVMLKALTTDDDNGVHCVKTIDEKN